MVASQKGFSIAVSLAAIPGLNGPLGAVPDWQATYAALADIGIVPLRTGEPQSVAGGDISDAWRLPTESGPVFLKTGPIAAAEMFAAEAAGLGEICTSATLRVPRALGAGTAGPVAWLALEWLDIQPANGSADERLGQQLAAMHRCTGSAHGWHRDNTIGSTPQQNTRTTDWSQFWRDVRLHPQLELAARYGYTGRLQELGVQLLDALPEFLAGHEPEASLLHGDLWSGNRGSVADEPVVFDPAVYYGDRETDLAMTRLFGGFSERFYAAYEASWPLSGGHQWRLPMYQLYHLLNHLNLFGSGYLGRCEAIIEALLDGSTEYGG